MGKLVPIMAALEIFKFYLISEQMLLFKCEWYWYDHLFRPMDVRMATIQLGEVSKDFT